MIGFLWVKLLEVLYEGVENHCIIKGDGNITKKGFQTGNFINFVSVEIQSGITGIESNSFYRCFNLQSVSIGSGVVNIDQYAFYQCNSLVNVIFSENLQKIDSFGFAGCEKLTSPAFPNSLRYIGSYAYQNCKSILSIIFNETSSKLEEIEAWAFSYCSSISNLSLPNSLIKILDYAFYATSIEILTIPNKVQTIDGSTFSGTKIKKIICEGNPNFYVENEALIRKTTTANILVRYPNNLAGTFYIPDTINGLTKYCVSETLLKEIRISSNVSTIPYRFGWASAKLEKVQNTDHLIRIAGEAFLDCISLKTISLNAVDTIEFRAFQKCVALSGVLLPITLKEIGEGGFSLCSSLGSITIPQNLVIWGPGAFSGMVISISTENNRFKIDEHNIIYSIDYKNLIHVPFDIINAPLNPELTNIGSDTFRNIITLRSVSIGSKVDILGISCFSGCTQLEQIDLPSSVRTISLLSFFGCSNLKILNISLDSKLTTLGIGCFKGCGIEKLIIPSQVQSISSEAFINCPKLTKLEIFSNAIINSELFMGSNNIEEITIGSRIIFQNSFNKVGKINRINILNTVEKIESTAFYGNTDLTQVNFEPTTIFTTIEPQAFSGCSSLETITLPNSIIEFSASSFSGCYLLKTVEFMSGDCIFETLNKGIYKSNRMEFVMCPPGLNKIVIERTISIIGQQAFYFCKLLKEIHLGQDLRQISRECFYGCTSLESITIPTMVTNIEERAFLNCDKLNYIFYCGFTDANITFAQNSNLFSDNSIIYVNDDYIGNTFCSRKVIKSSSKNQLECPNVPSIMFSTKKSVGTRHVFRIFHSFIFLNRYF